MSEAAVWAMLARAARAGGDILNKEHDEGVRLTDAQRLDWLRLIRSENIGPRGIMAQTPRLVAFAP